MSGTQPNAKRTRPMVTLTLSPEALERLDDLAKRRGITRSAAADAVIRSALPAPRRPPKTAR